MFNLSKNIIKTNSNCEPVQCVHKRVNHYKIYLKIVINNLLKSLIEMIRT